MNAKQAKIEILERAIKKQNERLKTATGQYRKYLLADILECHRTLARLLNFESNRGDYFETT